MKLLMGFVILAVVIIGAWLLYSNLSDTYKPASPKPTQTHVVEEDDLDKAYDFIVVNEDGEDVQFFDMLGRPTIINFWASWCSPCKSELPDFQAMYEKYGSKVRFMMINLTDGAQETKKKAQKFISENEYTMPFYFDVYQSAVSRNYIYSIPTTIFVDHQGNMINTVLGAMDQDSLEQEIQVLLSK